MHIAAVVRLVPDLTDELELNEEGDDLDREWVGLRLNEFDEQALEEAILLKEAHGGTVTALALAAPGSRRMLQTAIARGADKALSILGEGGEEAHLDSCAAAPLLAEAVRDIGADLVLTGVQTNEDLFGQLAPRLAALLGWPQLSAVSGVAMQEGKLVARQEYSGGRSARYAIALPAVLGIQTASQAPRYVSASKLKQAMQEVEIAERDAGAAPPPSGAKRRALKPPPETGSATLLSGNAESAAKEIVSLLEEKGLLAGESAP